jgi:hypothetical protein
MTSHYEYWLRSEISTVVQNFVIYMVINDNVSIVLAKAWSKGSLDLIACVTKELDSGIHNIYVKKYNT